MRNLFGIRKLHVLVIKEFAGPFMLTFFISLFVLVMQFLWKYIDDLVGKGLEWNVVGELIFYTSITLVPLALPLAILVSSIMTFGNLAEHFEIVATKAAGVSLQKTMRPLLIVAFGISAFAFLFSNYVLPVANLKMGSLLYDVRQQKPALYIREGVFYNGIDGYSIRIGRKEPDGKILRDIMIYDHTNISGNRKVITAKSGEMKMSDDERYMLLTLLDGNSYEEGSRNRDGRESFPLTRTQFESETIRFDLSTFKLSRTNEDLFKDNWQMLNFKQLTKAIDSLEKKFIIRKAEIVKDKSIFLPFLNDSLAFKTPVEKKSLDSSVSKIISVQNTTVYDNAIMSARNARIYIDNNKEELDAKKRTITRFSIEWHRKFTLSIACYILFLIGAPFGAIVRKGGLGLPIVVSILFFLLFHVISITGEKFAKEDIISPAYGMWIAPMVLFPVGIILVYKATHDSVLFDTDAYLNFFKKFRKRKA